MSSARSPHPRQPAADTPALCIVTNPGLAGVLLARGHQLISACENPVVFVFEGAAHWESRA